MYQEHQWDKVIIAMDRAPYWRKAAMQRYYDALPARKKGDKYYVFEGALFYAIEPPAEGEEKATRRALTPAEEKDAVTDVVEPTTAPWPILWPTYKGNRAGRKWECETPKEVFNSLKERLAERIARLVKGQVVALDGAEADDIAAVVAYEATRHEVVLLTGDGDWRYLLLRGPHMSIHSLYSGVKEKHSEDMAESIVDKLHCKIIAGDSGDNVPGCARRDRKGRRNAAQAGAEKLLRESGSWKVARDHLVESQLRRNAELMVLAPGFIPDDIWQGVKKALAVRKQYSTEPMSWDDLGLLPKERERIEIAGGASRIFAQWITDPAKAAESVA